MTPLLQFYALQAIISDFLFLEEAKEYQKVTRNGVYTSYKKDDKTFFMKK